MLCANRVCFGVGVVALVTSCMMMTGCGGANYDGPARGAVSGAVTFDGNPLPFGIMTLVPEGEGRRASGIVMNGEYTISEDRGPNAGSYKVEILGYAKAPPEDTETQDTEDQDGEEEGEGDADLGPQILPAKYNTETTLTVEIAAGENTHDFTMTGGE